MKKRADVLLVEQGFFDSREIAKANIMAGNVFSDQILVDKPGSKFDEQSIFQIKNQLHPYVSRGGLKLEKALSEFDLNLENKVCMDIGASTGGFTDCMLQKGATKVYAVDVGYGQLAWTLRNNSRVVCMERTNIRYLNTDLLKDKIDFVSIDVSFISLKLVFPVLDKLIDDQGDVIALIKPQFEAGRDEVKKGKGVIKDKIIHEKVIGEIINFFSTTNFKPQNISFSPIKGPKGNIEFLLHLCKGSDVGLDFDYVQTIVDQAHKKLS